MKIVGERGYKHIREIWDSVKKIPLDFSIGTLLLLCSMCIEISEDDEGEEVILTRGNKYVTEFSQISGNNGASIFPDWFFIQQS